MNRVPAARNIPLFIAFRVFFNARWYYPVLAVLFLVGGGLFGLTFMKVIGPQLESENQKVAQQAK